jgi:hypothetical protein
MFKIETCLITDQQAKLFAQDSRYRNYDTTWAAAHHCVTSQGPFCEIGSGLYGVVYGSRKSKIVYKIGDARDDAYLDYVRVIATKRNPNPYLPVIFGCRIYKHPDFSPVYLVAMERLRPLVGNQFHKQCTNLNQHLLWRHSLDAGLFADQSAIFDAVDVILKAKRNRVESEIDLHGENFMKRGRQLVITDPLA